jgi:D-proline reductase (dithiol) PrdB
MRNLPEQSQKNLRSLECPTFEAKPWVADKPLNEQRVALISSAGLHLRDDRRFAGGESGYREIPNDSAADNILMSHVSVNFDRTAFQQDLNAIFPLERMAELAAEGFIGAVAGTHYSFMGATDPRKMETEAHELAGRLKADNVDSAILIPV